MEKESVKDYFQLTRRGIMLVLSSPSGAGKTTLSQRLLASDPRLKMSISMTTRARRPSEQAGKDYHFVSQEVFDEKARANAFLEHANVFGHSYGTPKAPVEAALADGYDVLFDIDWQGTQQLAHNARADLVSVFILPPSLEELEDRLKRRDQDNHDVVAKRMAKAADEMSHWAEYDYVIVNFDIEHSLQQLQAILIAERLRRQRQVGLHQFVRRLRGE